MFNLRHGQTTFRVRGVLACRALTRLDGPRAVPGDRFDQHSASPASRAAASSLTVSFVALSIMPVRMTLP